MGMTSFSLGGMVACFRNWAEKLATGGQLEVLKTRFSSKFSIGIPQTVKTSTIYTSYVYTHMYVHMPTCIHAYVRV